MNHQLTFVTGKGGVGKTFISLLLQQQNPRSVLSEIATALHSEASKWNIKAPQPHRFSSKDLAETFLQRTLKVGFLSEWISENKLFQNLMELAPNLTELLLLEQWMKLTAESPVIVDAPSTGHFIGLFDAIQSARVLFDSGSLRKMADGLHEFFSSSAVKIVIVSLPEHSSLEESKQIETSIRKAYPNLEVRNYLNRKHQVPTTEIIFDEPWKSLAFKRPELESQRIAQLKFDQVISEGQLP